MAADLSILNTDTERSKICINVSKREREKKLTLKMKFVTNAINDLKRLGVVSLMEKNIVIPTARF